jgi:malate dehydrogenase (oxaloacetate-decarboxylating)(NADP+)
MKDNCKRVAGMYLMMTKQGPLFFADTTLNLNPTSEQLVEIALLASEAVHEFGITPRIAMLSYSNFGSSENSETKTVRDAVKILHEKHPNVIVDGELQANLALNTNLLKEQFPFSVLAKERPNTLIFPNLASGNIAYKLIQEIGGAEAIGPILLGLKKSVHILQLGSTVREIVDMVTIAVVDAQRKKL